MAHGEHICLVSTPLTRDFFNVAHGVDRTVKKQELLSVQKWYTTLCAVPRDAKDFCKVCLSVLVKLFLSLTSSQMWEKTSVINAQQCSHNCFREE